MSSTNHTTNYNLPQFIGTDKPAWLGDVNPALSAIDAQMKLNADAASAAAGAASTADGKAVAAGEAASTADGKAETAQTTANGAVSRITALEGKFNLTTYERKTAAELVSVTGIATDGLFQLAQDTDGSVFKFYNFITLTNSTSASITFPLVAVPGFTGIYGLKVFTLAQAPAEAYSVLSAGIYVYKNGANLQNITSANFLVGSDGGVYVFGNTTSNWGLQPGQSMQLILHPSIYFNANFGD